MVPTKVTLLSTQHVLNTEINVYGDFENPLFLAKDVAEWIEHSNPSMMLRTVDDDEKVLNIVYTLGGEQEALMLTENGLYEVLMQSRKPIAKDFKREVKKMLRSVRLNGLYATPEKVLEILAKPESLIAVLGKLHEEQTMRVKAESEIAELKPKAELMEKVLDCDQKIDIGQAAKILSLPFGRNTLFAQLRERGIFFKHRNEPKQEYIDRGYFVVRETWIEPNNHDGFSSLKVWVTQRGLEFIAKLFGVIQAYNEIDE